MRDVKCPACSHEAHIISNFNWTYYCCPGCHFLFKKEDYKLVKQKELDILYDKFLTVGQKGNYNNKTYEVTGILRKRDNEYYKWTEYILQNSEHEFLYISEYQGNWTILEEVNNLEDLSRKTNGIISLENEHHIQLEQTKTVCNIFSAEGFLDFDPTPTIYLTEKKYGNYLISSETINAKTTHYLGKKLGKQKLKSMFTSFAQPLSKPIQGHNPIHFQLDIKKCRAILGITALLLIIFNIEFISPLQDVEINREQIAQNDKKASELTSSTFNIPGYLSGTLDIDFTSNLSNSWASCDVALVNEQTQSVVYSTKDLEYYHGVEDGESWSEGDQSGQLSICGVKPGKYHLEFTFTFDTANIYKPTNLDSVTKQLDSISNNIKDSARVTEGLTSSASNSSSYSMDATYTKYITIASKFSRPQYWNLNLTLVFLFLCFCIIEKIHFERNRYKSIQFYDCRNHIKSNIIAISIATMAVLFYVLTLFWGGRVCDCSTTEMDQMSLTHSAHGFYYHK